VKPVNKKKSFEASAFLQIFIFLTLTVAAGCATVGPDYVPPEFNVEQSWHTNLKNGLSMQQPDPETLAQWWSTLNDPVLSDLMDLAIMENPDLKEALARIREARARRGISEARLFPAVDKQGTFTQQRSSENAGIGSESKLYSLGFDAGWELDIFGGIRRSVEAAHADLQAAEEDFNQVLVTLLAEVALNYVQARTFQTRIKVAEANLGTQEETYSLIRYRFEAGLIDELPVKQALYNLENTRSQIPVLRVGLEASKNRVAVLIGKQPGTVHEKLAPCGKIPVTPLSVAAGVPAETLRHRPDIRRAERRIAAQNARIGVAEANLYPRFQLNGSIGLESFSSATLFNSGSHTWRFGPSIFWNLFDAGTIRRSIDVQTALQDQAVIQYESTVLNALEEVENALAAFAEEQFRRESLINAVDAARQASHLSQDRFTAGLVDFSSVLDSQRSLLSFQDQLAQTEGEVIFNLIRLYKALGGGWTNYPKNISEEQTTSNKIIP
jgi:NodT family efflux transporter outer membrane factor (OMF) lipoprotein